nr:hypothetical protein [Tanacetum cinerariifolium]
MIDADKDVTLEEVEVDKNAEVEKHDDELKPAKLKEVVEVVTTTKLMTKVVTVAAATITTATTPITAAIITAAPKKTNKQLEEEESRALKRTSESLEEKAAKKQKLDEEVPVVDDEIYIVNNKPYFKIIRVDGTYQLFLSFLSLLRNFDRKDLEMLWQIVKERFASSKPKNFSDNFLLTTLTYMFEKPDVEAQVWKN